MLKHTNHTHEVNEAVLIFRQLLTHVASAATYGLLTDFSSSPYSSVLLPNNLKASDPVCMCLRCVSWVHTDYCTAALMGRGSTCNSRAYSTNRLCSICFYIL